MAATPTPYIPMDSKGSNSEQELQREIDRLRQNNAILHKSLLDAQLQIYALETLIEIAEQEWRIEIRSRIGGHKKTLE